MTVGMPAAWRRRPRGPRPSNRAAPARCRRPLAAMKSCTTLIWPSRSFSSSGPFQMNLDVAQLLGRSSTRRHAPISRIRASFPWESRRSEPVSGHPGRPPRESGPRPDDCSPPRVRRKTRWRRSDAWGWSEKKGRLPWEWQCHEQIACADEVWPVRFVLPSNGAASTNVSRKRVSLRGDGCCLDHPHGCHARDRGLAANWF